MPTHIKLRYSTGNLDSDAASRKKKGKSVAGENDLEVQKQREASQEKCLATLDIFAGCGGLSEGLQMSGNSLLFSFSFTVNAFHFYLFRKLMDPLTADIAGASLTKWAIEYEQPAGDAFKCNHPESLVFINNCNVILR